MDLSFHRLIPPKIAYKMNFQRFPRISTIPCQVVHGDSDGREEQEDREDEEG